MVRHSLFMYFLDFNEFVRIIVTKNIDCMCFGDKDERKIGNRYKCNQMR